MLYNGKKIRKPSSGVVAVIAIASLILGSSLIYIAVELGVLEVPKLEEQEKRK